MDELEILYPKPAVATVGEVSAELYPIKLRNAQRYAELVGAVTVMLADGANETAFAAFSASHSHSLIGLLKDQTSLDEKTLDELTSVDAVQWLQFLMWNNMRDFNRALSATAQNLPDGAKSTSD